MLAPTRALIFRSVSCKPNAIPKTSTIAFNEAFKHRKQCYHSSEHESPPGPYNETEDAILSASMQHVPHHGFTEKALALGAKDCGYLDVSINLFPKKAFDLVNYHLITQRGALKDQVNFPELERDAGKTLGVGTKVRILAWKRLMANSKIIHRWQEVGLLFCSSKYSRC